MSEKNRLETYFNDDYYGGLSNTNQKKPLSTNMMSKLFIDYRTLKFIFINLMNFNKTELGTYTVLDAGCGNGNLLRTLINFFDASPQLCYGIDISQNVLDYAKTLTAPDVTYTKASLDKTPYESDMFDLIFNMGVIIHVMDDRFVYESFKEFHRILKPEGLFFLLVSNNEVKWKQEISHTTRNYETEDIQRLGNDFFEVVAKNGVYTQIVPKHMGHFPVIEFDWDSQKVKPGFDLYVLKKK